MKTCVAVLLFGLLCGGRVLQADDQPDAKPLLDRAIKAMGGAAKLAKLGTAAAKAKITGSDNGQEFNLELDGTWQGRDHYHVNVDFQAGGQMFKGVLVLNGDKGWLKKDDETKDAPEGIVQFIQNIFHAGRMPQLLPALRDTAYTLSPLGEVKVGAHTEVGLAVSHKDRKDVSLFFDKDTGLPLKCEIRQPAPRGDKESTVEFIYSDYKDFDGVKLSGKIAIKLDDKDLTMELRELKAAEKADDGRFDRP